jgi:glycosyltransferase involved in cell wall biosynthesis
MPVSSSAVSRNQSLARATQVVSHRSIRVLFFNHTATQGGGEIALLNLVRNLDPQEVTPIVVLAADGPIVEKIRPFAETHVLPLARSVGDARKDSLGVGSVLQIRAVFSVVAYIWMLVRVIRQYQIDLVHTNSLKADLLGGIAARLSRRPVIWHVRDRIDDDYLPPMVVRIFRSLCRHIPNFVVANSNATLRSLRLPILASNSAGAVRRYFVVHDGTYCPNEDKNTTAETNGPAQIALIGRISPWKGQHIFLQAAALVRRRVPDARFLIVGSALFGEVEYDRNIRRLASELGIADVVTFTGFCSDIHTLIARMDLVVHASTIGEPFGQVIIEAMSASKPVVATNGGGVPEIVEDAKTGILVPMGDAPAMAEGICQIIADPHRARDMGNRGRERVRKNFTIEHTARKVESIYREVMCGIS